MKAGQRCHAMGDGKLMFECPGCGCGHFVFVGNGRWTWNGSLELPTLSPSVRVEGYVADKPVRCHSWVRDGHIQFLRDCDHELAGQTVPLPTWSGADSQ